MSKKLISAVLLACLACLSAPLALAVAKGSLSSQQDVQPTPSAAQDHSCCPGIHSRLISPVVLAPLPVPQMPCGDRHPCCAKQGPENTPALTASTRLGPDQLQAAFASIQERGTIRNPRLAAKASSDHFSPAFSRSTVLRI